MALFKLAKFKILSLITSSQLRTLPRDGTLLAVNGFEGAMIPVGIDAMGVKEMWKENLQGQGIFCAVVDTGIESKHSELSGAVIEKYWLPELRDEPLYQHGTHIAGTISARGMLRGVAPKCGLIDVRVYNSKGEARDGGVAEGIRWINRRITEGLNVRVVNLSLGGKAYVEEVALELAKLDQQGVAVVVAAGNGGDGKADTTETSFPASVVTSIAVAAYNPRDNTIADFSESNEYLSCAAPGVQVLSTFPGGYGVLDGTSMAAAHVSGFCCLLFQKISQQQPQLKGRPLLQEVKRQLLHNYSVNPESKGYSREYGYGYLKYGVILKDMEVKQLQQK